MDILITTAIVSLLSSLFLFRVSEAKKKAEDGQLRAETHEVSNAVALYRANHDGQAPISGSGTLGIMHAESDPNSDYLPTMQMLVDQGYLSEIPRSQSGSKYVYGVTEDGQVVFGTKLNYGSSANTKNSCPAVPATSGGTSYPTGYGGYSFGSCNPVASCAPGQLTDTTSCFAVSYSDISNKCYCGSPDLVSQYQGIFPVGICYRHMACPDPGPGGGMPLPPPDSSFLMPFSSIAYAQVSPIINITGTKYYVCSHNSVPAQTTGDPTQARCDGSSNSDYCQCI